MTGRSGVAAEYIMMRGWDVSGTCQQHFYINNFILNTILKNFIP